MNPAPEKNKSSRAYFGSLQPREVERKPFTRFGDGLPPTRLIYTDTSPVTNHIWADDDATTRMLRWVLVEGRCWATRVVARMPNQKKIEMRAVGAAARVGFSADNITGQDRVVRVKAKGGEWTHNYCTISFCPPLLPAEVRSLASTRVDTRFGSQQ